MQSLIKTMYLNNKPIYYIPSHLHFSHKHTIGLYRLYTIVQVVNLKSCDNLRLVSNYRHYS